MEREVGRDGGGCNEEKVNGNGEGQELSHREYCRLWPRISMNGHRLRQPR